MKKMTVIFIYVFILCAWFSLQAQETIKIIVNNNVANDELSQNDIQKIFLGKKQAWSDGSKIVPATLKEGPIYEHFLNDLVKRSPSQFKAFWTRAIYTGTGVPPVSFSEESELIDYVSLTPGAVGYVSEDTAITDVKVLQIKK